MTGERERCLAAGMTNYVSKPFHSGSAPGGPFLPQFPSPCEEPAIDEAELTVLRSEGEEAGIDLLAQLKQAFELEATEALRILDQAFEERDGSTVARTAHKLKGSAGNFGAKPLQARCLELESLSAGDNLEFASARLAAVRREINRVIAALSGKQA